MYTKLSTEDFDNYLERVGEIATSGVTHRQISPRHVAQALGSPTYDYTDRDYSKRSREWIFKDEQDNIYTVYDYKSTSLYDDELPTPEAFWERGFPDRIEFGMTTHFDGTSRIEIVDRFIDFMFK